MNEMKRNEMKWILPWSDLVVGPSSTSIELTACTSSGSNSRHQNDSQNKMIYRLKWFTD